jgi:peroxiredoxin
MDRRALLKAIAGSGLAAALPAARAALDVGDKAPDFTAQGSLGGKVFPFHLSDALKSGPVVLYFYPAAFSTGCTVEAHQFAEAAEQFKALGATVIGVSHDDIDTLNRFSVTECRSKFAVLADTDQSIMKAYDAVLTLKPEYANRVSYVIAPNSTVVYQYTSLNPFKHVANTMNALKGWKTQHAAAG